MLKIHVNQCDNNWGQMHYFPVLITLVVMTHSHKTFVHWGDSVLYENHLLIQERVRIWGSHVQSHGLFYVYSNNTILRKKNHCLCRLVIRQPGYTHYHRHHYIQRQSEHWKYRRLRSHHLRCDCIQMLFITLVYWTKETNSEIESCIFLYKNV